MGAGAFEPSPSMQTSAARLRLASAQCTPYECDRDACGGAAGFFAPVHRTHYVPCERHVFDQGGN